MSFIVVSVTVYATVSATTEVGHKVNHLPRVLHLVLFTRVVKIAIRMVAINRRKTVLQVG